MRTELLEATVHVAESVLFSSAFVLGNENTSKLLESSLNDPIDMRTYSSSFWDLLDEVSMLPQEYRIVYVAIHFFENSFLINQSKFYLVCNRNKTKNIK